MRCITALAVVSMLLVAIDSRASAREPVTYRPPVSGPVTDPFRPPLTKYSAGNRGLDYDTSPGEAVRAAAAGDVVFAGRVGDGLHVVIRHADGIRTTYSFLRSISVSRGNSVAGADEIGTAGDSLHFGARAGDAYVDPAILLASDGRVHLVPERTRARHPARVDVYTSTRDESCRSSLCRRYRRMPGNPAREIYFRFSAAEISKLRTIVKKGELDGRGVDWGTDSCSTPGGKITNGTMEGKYGNACGKHDFGYRNHAAIFGRTSEHDRKRVDNQLRRDLQDVCTQFDVVVSGRTTLCYGEAEVMYRFVRQFGSYVYR